MGIHEVVAKGNEVFNNHDLGAFSLLTAPDGEFHGPGGVVVRGREAIREYTEGWFRAFPDARSNIQRTIISGNTVVAEGIFTGTHTGVLSTPAGDIPPTGRRIEGRFVEIFEVENDLVTMDRMMFDRMELIEQLGLIPEPEPEPQPA